MTLALISLFTFSGLERRVAELLGKERGLFVPSGTMSNLLSVMVHCNERGSEMFLGDKSHIFLYEQGGASFVSSCLVVLVLVKTNYFLFEIV